MLQTRPGRPRARGAAAPCAAESMPQSSSAQTRGRQYDDIEGLTQVLQKHVVDTKFVQWSPDTGKEEKQVQAMQPMLKDLKALQPNMSFKKMALHKAFRQVAARNEEQWALADLAKDWATKSTSRLTSICQWLKQKKKNRKTGARTSKLLKELLASSSDEEEEEEEEEQEEDEEDDEEGEEEEAEVDEEEEPEDGEEEEEEEEEEAASLRPAAAAAAPAAAPAAAGRKKWEYDFDTEMLCGFRTPKGATEPVEVAIKTGPAPGASHLDSPQAVFSDGSTWTVSSLTNEQLQSMKGSRGKHKGWPFEMEKKIAPPAGA